MKKKALIGFVVVLVLTLTLAGLTMYKVAEIFGLHQTQKAMDSFYRFVYKVNDSSVRPVGTKESTALYVDEKSTILGFSKNSKEIFIPTGINHHSPRPPECIAGNACICLCRDYDWRIDFSKYEYYFGMEFLPIRCRESFICENFQDFDFPQKMTKEDFGMDIEMEGGFIIARNFMLGDQKIEARLTGIYITNEAPGLVSVSYNVEGVSKETLQRQNERDETGKMMWEANTAFTNKQWDTAIQKYDEIISKGYLSYLSEGSKEQVYLFRAMCYYNKHDRENTLEAMDEALNHTEDDTLKKMIREKMAEAETW
ncbi:hypothetical protein COV19_06510 [Candidatus Woesearchaeota archaeon CG10_big_fil_rev_8_21_14_0_10_44_13]|nr:MAG: hypothetical protein COV19_06510 [Candidatus Woesearchaeota archaeon CG10_big_fil_rev_8_21_14_0_10_44_13]